MPSSRTANAAAPLAVVAAATLVVFTSPMGADYERGAGPAIRALLDLDLNDVASSPLVYGSFSVLLRAPFAGIGVLLGGSEKVVYQLGALPCLVAVGLLGLYLARAGARRGLSVPARFAVVSLSIVNPLTFSALQYGHPEEFLAAALVVGAVILAGRDAPLRAGVVLGLALATKQWTVIAVLPALLVASGQRVRLLAAAAAVAAALTLPIEVANPGNFASSSTRVANLVPIADVTPPNIWAPFASREPAPETFSDWQYVLPRWVGIVSHPLIVVLPLPLSLLYLRRRRGAEPEQVLGLLALLFLLRSVLDPLDNGYYHYPFLLSLLAYDTLSRRGFPVMTLMVAALMTLSDVMSGTQPFMVQSFFYLGWALPVTVYLAGDVFRLWRAPVWPRLASAVPVRLDHTR